MLNSSFRKHSYKVIPIILLTCICVLVLLLGLSEYDKQKQVSLYNQVLRVDNQLKRQNLIDYSPDTNQTVVMGVFSDYTTFKVSSDVAQTLAAKEQPFSACIDVKRDTYCDEAKWHADGDIKESSYYFYKKDGHKVRYDISIDLKSNELLLTKTE